MSAVKRDSASLAQVLVESALVFPLVFLLSLGGLQVVLYAHAQAVLTSAAQEGARLAAEDGRGVADGYGRARALVRAGLGTSADPVVLSANLDNDVVALSIAARLRPILPLPGVGELPVQARGQVTRERFRPGGGVR